MNLSCRLLRPSITGFLLVCTGALCPAQSPLNVPVPHPKASGNLPELLRFVAQQYRLPIVAEVMYPAPILSIPAGTNTAQEVLLELTKSVPEYKFELVGKTVVHFCNKDIENSPGNFLNVRLRRFSMPPNVSEFKVLFPARVGAARRGFQGEGVVTTGFGDPHLQKDTLPRIEFKDASAREILLRAAEETRGFYSIVVFPNRSVLSEASVNYTFQHWFWGSVQTKDDTPMYIQRPIKD